MRLLFRLLMPVLPVVVLTQCAPMSGKGVLMGGPTAEQRALAIATEPTGDFYYGRRYYIEKTRFWGYLREPRSSWKTAKLVMMREDQERVPDRLAEDGPQGRRYGYDQNFQYRIKGHYTGRKAYDPNSNQILPEFMLTGYELVDPEPGWLFTPDDRYHPQRVTLLPH